MPNPTAAAYDYFGDQLAIGDRVRVLGHRRPGIVAQLGACGSAAPCASCQQPLAHANVRIGVRFNAETIEHVTDANCMILRTAEIEGHHVR